MRHLLELGHQRITFLLGEQPPHYSVTGRQQGYQSAMRAAGLDQHANVFAGSNESFVESLASASSVEPQNDPNRPTAVLVYTHRQAVKLLQQLWDAGVS